MLFVQFKQGVFKTIDGLLQRPSMIDMRTEHSETALPLAAPQPTNAMNLVQVRPQRGQLYHLSGPGHAGRSMRPVAEQWVAQALASGRVVHWVDGACRVDPSRVLPLLATLRADIDACLSRLYLSRGFTLHQLDRQLERLSRELSITRSPLLVVDGLLAMHEDDAIKRRESRALFRRHVKWLQMLAEQQHVAIVVITEHHATSPHQQRLVQGLHRRSQQHLIGHWQGSRRRRHLVLYHPRSGLRGRWQDATPQHQSRLRFTQRRPDTVRLRNGTAATANLRCRVEPLTDSSNVDNELD